LLLLSRGCEYISFLSGLVFVVRGNNITDDENSYFNRDYIKAYFLDNPLHAKYINTAALEKYWDVGGVRIEDCILVTDTGYENLTTAPKGEEMLKVINA